MTTNRNPLGSIIIVILLIGAIVGAFAIFPTYRVWSQELRGKADLREAEWSRQIAIEEAKAMRESATLYAEAEVERAKGVAEANLIIGESLEGNEAYLRYLWIQQLASDEGARIYIPTEANLPILEAGR